MPLPTSKPVADSHDDGISPVEQPVKALRNRFFRVLAASTLVITMIYGLQRLSRSGLPNFFRPSCWKGIHGSAPLLPTHFTLPSGDKIPSVALGSWRSGPGEVGRAVQTALKAGYRHIDTAWAYKNEAEIGEALKASNIPRNEVWLTSKLWNTFHAPEDVEPALDESLARLGTDYLDLYLIHWPVAQNKDGTLNKELTENNYPTWQKLEELVAKGKIRNIGVSNFNIRRFEKLTSNSLKIQPAVNQVELNFWNPQPELVKWAKEKGILLEAYSPLGSQNRVKDSLDVPEVKEISQVLGITPAQVLISWQVQRGAVVLPKSVTPSRIVENLLITKIPDRLFNTLEAVATSHKPERSVDPSKKWGVDIFE
ncbi:putative aldo/keto reductase family protein [Lyophyllum shimeji]|uniref:Aldo/keto reductase family protein n=1 Tax=Lyophyllum shimeji TaxID=47721 RepID=A0A9P3UKW3_LYOSH|nr:putative aldo/keto reductase family protein [Lyophyllum shimeji]